MSSHSKLYPGGSFNISLDELLYREKAHFAQTPAGVHLYAACKVQ